MFWGLIVNGSQRYSEKVTLPFHISMATINVLDCSREPIQLMMEFQDENYLLCTLNKRGPLQVALDLTFKAGDEVSFMVNGESEVHLSGSILEDVMPPKRPRISLEDLTEEEFDYATRISSGSRKIRESCKTEGFINNDKRARILHLLDDLDEEGISFPCVYRKVVNDDSADYIYERLLSQTREENIDKSIVQENDECAKKKISEERNEDVSEEISQKQLVQEKPSKKENEMEKLPEKQTQVSPLKEKQPQNKECEKLQPVQEKPLKKENKTENLQQKQTDVAPEKQKQPQNKDGEKLQPVEEKSLNKENKTEKLQQKQTDVAPEKQKQPQNKEGEKLQQESNVNGTSTLTKKIQEKNENKQDQIELSANENITVTDAGNKLGTLKRKQPIKLPKKFIQRGVTIHEVVVGSGNTACSGQYVEVFYEARVLNSNKQFDNQMRGGPPFKFRLGAGEVIEGFDTGVDGMQVGGIRLVAFPTSLAIGSEIIIETIPENACIYFKIELVKLSDNI